MVLPVIVPSCIAEVRQARESPDWTRKEGFQLEVLSVVVEKGN
jgi:hypothetical protein